MAWYRSTNRTPPPMRGQVGRHFVEVHRNQNGRTSKVHVDGERYVKDRIRFGDLSPGQRAVVAGAYGVNAFATGTAVHYLHNLGTVVDSGVDAVMTTVNTGEQLLGKLFPGNQREALKNLESLVKSGTLDANSYRTSEDYLTNFTGYRATGSMIDQARANLDKEMSDAASASQRIMPPLPTDSIQARITDWINKNIRGRNVENPNYSQNNRPVINLRKDIYDTLQDSSSNVTNEMSKSNPNLSYAVEQMGKFNNAYSTLIKEEQSIRTGVENVNISEIRGMQQHIDQIKPLAGHYLHADLVLPVLGGVVVYRFINNRLVKPIKRILYNI